MYTYIPSEMNILAKSMIKFIVNYNFTRRSITSLDILTEVEGFFAVVVFFFFFYVTHKLIELLGKHVIFFWL